MITEEMLQNLRHSISLRLSERRYLHTLGVEEMATFIAAHCLPSKVCEASAAALLHDVTKEIAIDDKIEMLKSEDISSEFRESIPNEVLHSFTAPVVVKTDYPDFAGEEILSAIRKHTIGAENMSTLDKIIFLADFIEKSRTYPDSVNTRKFVLDSLKPSKVNENIKVLNRACVMEIDSTIAHLTRRGAKINDATFLAKKSLISNI